MTPLMNTNDFGIPNPKIEPQSIKTNKKIRQNNSEDANNGQGPPRIRFMTVPDVHLEAQKGMIENEPGLAGVVLGRGTKLGLGVLEVDAFHLKNRSQTRLGPQNCSPRRN